LILVYIVSSTLEPAFETGLSLVGFLHVARPDNFDL
jgi:hypothetical protein